MTAAPETEPLLTPTLLAILAACVWYFFSLGMMLVAIPVFVSDELGEGNLEVGLAMGAAGVAAALLRVVAGGITDAKGRRWVMVFGSTVAAVSMLGLLFADNVPAVVALRALTGIGEAAFFVGAATALQDVAPEGRRAEATSYFSAVVYASMALGPMLAEWLIERFGFRAMWLAATAFCALGALFSVRAPQNRAAGPDTRAFFPRPLVHPAAIRPGSVLLIGLFGFSSFLTFAALWAGEVGVEQAASLLLLFSGAVLIMRLALARLPDRLGARTTTTIALLFSAVGLVIMALWRSPAGAYTGSAVMAFGQTFLFPALFAQVIENTPAAERGQAVASFSISFDVAIGTGGFVAGAVAANLGGIDSAFWFGAGACILALLLGRATLSPREDRPSAPGDAPEDVPPPPRAGPEGLGRLRGS